MATKQAASNKRAAEDVLRSRTFSARFSDNEPRFQAQLKVEEFLTAGGGALDAANEICYHAIDQVFEEVRRRRLDAILQPYSVLHSIDNITHDLRYESICPDGRHDDCAYSEDQATTDPLAPVKDPWAVHDIHPGDGRYLETILKRQKQKEAELLVEVAAEFTGAKETELVGASQGEEMSEGEKMRNLMR